MTDLAERLERLGLSEYRDRLAVEGFDTWLTVLDITESDLNALGFKLGHRRKLQRAIAESRGQPIERALLLEHGKVAASDAGGYASDESMPDAKESSGHGTPAAQNAPTAGTKRKYRRHPKADENAPERPPSAYVIFSNQIREELKGQDLSFTEIAKLVGERWQVLDPAIREAFEKQAATAKEQYYAQMAEYKKTPQYQEYQQYLADFKAKHATPRSEGKRTKTQSETASDLSLGRIPSREHRRGSIIDTASHLRSHSNSTSIGLPAFAGYPPHSASTSPAQIAMGLQSPVTQHAFSPIPRSPASAPVFSGSYDLPHHNRATQSAAELRYPVGHNARPWQPPPLDESSTQSPLNSEFMSRRTHRAPSSLPGLVHQDTTASSHGDSLPPPMPYQAHVLPPLDPSKADRRLPQPLPSLATTVHGNPPYDMRSQAVAPAPRIPFDTLLRATELARDAEDEAARTRDRPK